MVALDKNMQPCSVKPLILETTIEKRRFEEARMRRETRLRFHAAHIENKQLDDSI